MNTNVFAAAPAEAEPESVDIFVGSWYGRQKLSTVYLEKINRITDMVFSNDDFDFSWLPVSIRIDKDNEGNYTGYCDEETIVTYIETRENEVVVLMSEVDMPDGFYYEYYGTYYPPRKRSAAPITTILPTPVWVL
jgi:hypothetical protein